MIAILLFALLASPGANSNTKSEFIYETAPFPSCHASTIVETAPGEFFAAWFGGTNEGNRDVAVWGARKTEGRWTPPVELVREPNTPAWNPVLFHDRAGTLWLYYKFGPSPREWTAGRLSSRDRGRSWSKPEHLPAGIYGPIKNKPLVLPNGTIVSGSSVESYQAWTSWIERSSDSGASWTRHGPLLYAGENYASIQPAMAMLSADHLLAYVRTTPRIGRIGRSESRDGGLTWSPLRLLDLPNPNSGIDAVTLRDGRIVLIYNHTSHGRTPLNLAVSRDGLTFAPSLVLEEAPGEYSYPAVIQAEDGALHVTYTWNRRKIRHVEIPLSALGATHPGAGH